MKILTYIFILLFPFVAFTEDFHFITSVTGDSVGDYFNYIANGHGDVNGDGYEDVLIGAPGDDLNCYAKLFLGSADFDTIPDLIFYPDTNGIVGEFGISCAFAGDVNSDGFDDIIIGAPYSGSIVEGRAYLYLGDEIMDNIPELIFFGEGWWNELGRYVSGAGDVNNDGYDDWLINAPSDDLYRYGKIYLYFGSDNPDEICDLYFQGQNYENLSFDYPLLGDINGDEYDDLAFLGIDFPNSSWVKIHYGSQEMDTIPDLIFYGENTSTWYGYPPCTGIGDINNDGHNDWLLRYGYDYGVYFGSLHPDTLTDMIITPEVPCHWINEIFAYGDIDGDNIDDIVVGGRDSINNSSGYVLGYLGGEEFDVNYDYIYESPVEYEYLSSRIGLADINGDDILEVLASGAGDNYGRVWFFSTQEWNFVDNEIIAHPNDAVLFDNHPNPFNPSTTIRFDLPETRKISLLVYDVMGREVAKLIDGINIAGFHEVVFDGKDLASGIYFAQLSAGEFSHTKKMVLMK